MRPRLAITLIAAAAFIAAACVGCGGEIVTYTDAEYGFSFEYDDSWDLTEASVDELPANASKSVGVYDPWGSHTSDNLTFDYFAVEVYELEPATAPTVNELLEGFAQYLQQLQDSDPSLQVAHEPARTDVNGRPAAYIEYLYTADSVDVRCTEYRLVGKGGIVYSLHTQSAVDNWEENGEVFSTFLDTFSLGGET